MRAWLVDRIPAVTWVIGELVEQLQTLEERLEETYARRAR